MTTTVLVDATSIPASAGGVGRYLTELVPALASRSDIVVHVVCQERDADMFRNSAPSATVHAKGSWIESVPRRLLWEQLGLLRLARRVGADVVHCPHYTMPIVPGGVRRVVTLHDATFFSHPDLHNPLKRVFFRFWISWSLRHADECVTPSQATRREVLTHTRASSTVADRVAVAYHGVDLVRYSPDERRSETSMRESLALGPSPYLAFVGTIEPRKNVPALLDAIARLRSSGREVRLFLAGGAGWDDVAVERLRSGEPGARWLGYVPERDLPVFLAAAQAVVYPSEGEGFGLPILEAMASGVPVLTTDRLAAPEVGGDVAVYCEPTAESIEAKLLGMLSDPHDLADRGRRGRVRAETFTWAASAEQHVSAYRAAAR